MDFLESFKRFFGFKQNPGNNRLPNETPAPWPDEPNFRPDDEEDMSFNVFSNQIQKQVEELMKNFGMPSGFFENIGPFQDLPALEGPNEPYKDSSQSLREHYLKPGYQRSLQNREQKDSDVDGQINVADLDSALKQQKTQQMTPHSNKPQIKFFGQSFSTKTIHKPDGTTVTHHTTRDQEGNEERTVTHKLGDKEYSVITRVDKNGKQETIENLINMEENEIGKLFKNDEQRNFHFNEEKDPNWYLFDKFFK